MAILLVLGNRCCKSGPQKNQGRVAWQTGGMNMSINVDYLPEVTVFVITGLLVVMLAIAVLRRLRTLFLLAAVAVGVCWGIALYPKYKDSISKIELPEVHVEMPKSGPPPIDFHPRM
jgi:hypothetical protein